MIITTDALVLCRTTRTCDTFFESTA